MDLEHHLSLIDLDDFTDDQIDEAFGRFFASLSRTQQEQILDILTDAMGITAPANATPPPNYEAAAAQFLAS